MGMTNGCVFMTLVIYKFENKFDKLIHEEKFIKDLGEKEQKNSKKTGLGEKLE